MMLTGYVGTPFINVLTYFMKRYPGGNHIYTACYNCNFHFSILP